MPVHLVDQLSVTLLKIKLNFQIYGNRARYECYLELYDMETASWIIDLAPAYA